MGAKTVRTLFTVRDTQTLSRVLCGALSLLTPSHRLVGKVVFVQEGSFVLLRRIQLRISERRSKLVTCSATATKRWKKD